MIMQEIILYLFVGASIASVLVIILNSNIFYGALALLVCLISLAGIYALLQAEFLAITQLLIYAGGVVVLLIFGIMLTNKISGKPLLTDSHNWFSGIMISASLFGILLFSFQQVEIISIPNSLNTSNHINKIGIELMSTYAAPFEGSGILLLVCLIGAALTASSFKKKPNG
jgi:NADH:ubiquinone oxidoreductase subunit 6 (subunit J)